MRRFSTALLLLMSPLWAQAGSGTGKVTFLLVNNQAPPVLAVFNVENYSGHACTTPNATLGRWVFTVDSSKGKEMLSLLMSAEARNVPVTVVGTGVCESQNREGVNFVYTGNPAL